MKCSFSGSVDYWVGLLHLHVNQTSQSFLRCSYLGDGAPAGSERYAPELPDSVDSLLG